MTRPLRHLAIAFCLLLPAAATATDFRCALLIGNDAYAEGRLQTCVNDARAMSDWLQSVGYRPENIQLLADADRDEMLRGLRELTEKCRRQRARQAVIYYSGHGMFLADDDSDEGPEDRLDEAFVGVFRERVPSADQIVLRDDQFYPFVHDLRQHCDQVILIIDSCFSGGATKNLDSPTAVKSLHEADVVLATGRRDLQDKSIPTARNIDRDRETAALAAPRPGQGQLLILTASNQYQLAQAGRPPAEPLSRFTAAFLDCVRQVDAEQTLTLTQLRQRLVAALRHDSQTPDVVPVGIDPDAGFVPAIFAQIEEPQPDPDVARLLHLLMTLPAASEQPRWTIHVTTTKPQPLAVGTRFALDVTTNQAGYLVVLMVEQSGRVAIQFPNRHARLNHVVADVPNVIPYSDAFRVKHPIGIEQFIVVLLDQDPFAKFDFGKYDGSLIVGHVDDVLRLYPELHSTLKKPGEAFARAIVVRPRPNAAPNPAAPPVKWARVITEVQTCP